VPPPPSEPRLRRARALVALAAAGLVLAALAVPASASDGIARAAHTDLEVARSARVQAEHRLAAATARREAVQARVARLDETDARLTDDLASARRRLREYAVAAYIDGGQSETVRAAMRPDEATTLAWRIGLVTDQATRASDAAHRYEALQGTNHPERVAAAEELDRVTHDEEEARSDLVQASAIERDADAAQQRAAAAARAAASATTTTTPAPSRRSGTTSKATAASTSKSPTRATTPALTSAGGTGARPTVGGASAQEAAFLAKVRACESGGNYRAISSTGRYRGAYQFSVETWRGVGGSGDPAAAPPAEQDARALALLRMQGTRAWPVCGR
jgi:hypothetical protein